MADLIRIVEVGGKSFCAWLEEMPSRMQVQRNDHYVTFTIEAEPFKSIPLSGWSEQSRKEEAIQYFKKWLAEEWDISLDAPSGVNLAEQLEKLAELHSKGALSEDEFAEAKRKLLNG